MSEVHLAGVAPGALASIAVATGVSAQQPQAPSASQEQKAATLVMDGVAAKPATDPACPAVSMSQGGETFPKKDDAYKVTLKGVARDCANLGAETILKVGFVGEGERDDKNGPSWFKAPVRLSVKDASGHEVEARKIPLKVQLAAGETKTPIDHVEEGISLPPPEVGGYAGWTVTVGFDSAASAAASVAVAAPAPAPAVKPVAKAVRTAAVRRATRTATKVVTPPPLPPRPQQPAQPAVTQHDSGTTFERLAAYSKERQTEAAIEAQRAQLAQARAQQLRAQQAGQQRQSQRPATPVPPQANAAPAQAKVRTALGEQTFR